MRLHASFLKDFELGGTRIRCSTLVEFLRAGVEFY